MSNCAAYPEYQSAVLGWMSEIPSHWELRRLKAAFTLQRRGVRAQDETVTAFRDGRVTLRQNRRTTGFTEADKEVGYQGVRRGDLVIHAMDAFAGAIGVSDSDGKSTPVYAVCTPRAGVSSGYFALLLRHLAGTGHVEALARGIRERSTDFRWNTAKDILLPFPPADEQRAIAEYLDRETGAIDAFIQDQEVLIGLLRERRAGTISRAVTRGLDPDARLRDSGFPLLGRIPVPWKARRLGTVIRERKRLVGSDWASHVLLSLSLQGIVPRDMQNIRGKLPSNFTTYQQVKCGDLVLCLFDVEETPRTVGYARQDGMVTGAYTVAEVVSDEVLPEYVAFVYQAYDEYKRLKPFYAGLRNTIRTADLKAIPIPVPPVGQQLAIIAFLKSALAELDAAVSDAREVISLLKERRSALISAAVTGKIDVREHAGV